mgnify:CR=1 FL=1
MCTRESWVLPKRDQQKENEKTKGTPPAKETVSKLQRTLFTSGLDVPFLLDFGIHALNSREVGLDVYVFDSLFELHDVLSGEWVS